MNIEIEFIGFPMIYDLYPEGRHRHNFAGRTILELVEDLIVRKGRRIKESLMEAGTDRLDPTLQVCINGRFLVRESIANAWIEDGDCITFLKLLAGG